MIALHHLLFVVAGWSAYGVDQYPADKLLPGGATIIEIAVVKDRADRAFVLWMINPKRVYRTSEPACNWLYGDYFYGPTRLSLINTSKNEIINTIEIRGAEELEKASFPVPFRVPKQSYYAVPGQRGEQKPQILRLRDLTGEGVHGQFVLYEFESCGSTLSSALGYSPALGRAVHYDIETRELGKAPMAEQWLPFLFTKAPIGPGVWNFTWEPGYGADCWIHQSVRFDRKRQMFINSQKITPYPDSSRTSK